MATLTELEIWRNKGVKRASDCKHTQDNQTIYCEKKLRGKVLLADSRWQIVIIKLPSNNNGRLPTLSMNKNEIVTPTNWHMFMIPLIFSLSSSSNPSVSKRVGESGG
jgi:hypothetical protein